MPCYRHNDSEALRLQGSVWMLACRFAASNFIFILFSTAGYNLECNMAEYLRIAQNSAKYRGDDITGNSSYTRDSQRFLHQDMFPAYIFRFGVISNPLTPMGFEPAPTRTHRKARSVAHPCWPSASRWAMVLRLLKAVFVGFS